MIPSLLKLAIITLMGFLLVKMTTFGWRPSLKGFPALSTEQRQIAENLKTHIKVLAEDIGWRNYETYENLDKTAQYIFRSFETLGYQTKSLSYHWNGRVFKNIVAEKSNSSSLEESVIIGAHYDSCFNPGADDNASGIAGLLELARLLNGVPLKTPLRFVAFVNEEPPFFMTEAMGSRIFVRAIQKEKQKIKAAIILEMIGYYSDKDHSQRYLPLLGPFYPHRANFIAVVGNFPSRKIVKRIVQGFKKGSSFPIEWIVAPGFIPGINFSDHWSFWKEGLPAVMITDTAYLRNPHYHRTTDFPSTLDYERMAVMLLGLKESLTQFLNYEEPLFSFAKEMSHFFCFGGILRIKGGL